jgi:hypothetical protein
LIDGRKVLVYRPPRHVSGFGDLGYAGRCPSVAEQRCSGIDDRRAGSAALPEAPSLWISCGHDCLDLLDGLMLNQVYISAVTAHECNEQRS